MEPAAIRPAAGLLTFPPSTVEGPLAGEPEYRPFPNEEGRNTRQATLEVPLMVHALGLLVGERFMFCRYGASRNGVAAGAGQIRERH